MPTDTLLLDEPRYSYAEADRVAGGSRGTSKRWLEGYQYYAPDGRTVQQPAVSSDRPVEPGVSFLELLEVTAIGRLKEHGFSLPRLRELLAAACAIMGVPRPLVQLTFRTDGEALFIQRGKRAPLVAVSRPRGQQAWDTVLEPFLRTIEYEGEVASRWWPMGREQHVIVGPRYCLWATSCRRDWGSDGHSVGAVRQWEQPRRHRQGLLARAWHR